MGDVKTRKSSGTSPPLPWKGKELELQQKDVLGAQTRVSSVKKKKKKTGGGKLCEIGPLDMFFC